MFDRRRLMSWAAGAIATVPAAARAQPHAEPRMQTYSVDLDGLAKAFPERALAHGLPASLRRFGTWLHGKPWGAVGTFDLTTRWSDSYFPGAEARYDDFALFIRLPDGSSAGYWLAGGDPARAPIVLLGSEGERVVLAPDLETLIARIALGRFSSKGAEAEFLYPQVDFGQGRPADLRVALKAFLRDELGVTDPERRVGGQQASGEFVGWMERAARDGEQRFENDPSVAAMWRLLQHYRPAAGAPLVVETMVNVTWAGDHFRAWVAAARPKPLPETEALRPHLAALRDKAAETPGLGLWHGASLMVGRGRINRLVTNYIYQPEFSFGRPPAEAFREDQARAPRAARRIPSWLGAMLAG
ncbi:hypothetical protein BN1110_05343 [bacterium YEK0313]|nr:hypothetical protein BN1110_05343 [bacterium YEK0313]